MADLVGLVGSMTVDEHDCFDWFDEQPDSCQLCFGVVDSRQLRRPNVPYTEDELFCDACASEIEERYGNESFIL